jgi:hypothetical protein
MQYAALLPASAQVHPHLPEDAQHLNGDAIEQVFVHCLTSQAGAPPLPDLPPAPPLAFEPPLPVLPPLPVAATHAPSFSK